MQNFSPSAKCCLGVDHLSVFFQAIAIDTLASVIQLRCGYGPAYQEALNLLAPDLFDAGELLFGLDPFSDCGYPQASSNANYQFDDGEGICAGCNVADERAIDLYFIEGEAP